MSQVRQILTAQKPTFLQHVSPAQLLKVSEQLIQHCVYPRMLMSPADSVYSFQFFTYLNELDTPGLDIISFYDRVFRSMTPLIFCSTESEAAFIGYGVNEVLAVHNSWSQDRAKYEGSVSSRSGFLVACGVKELPFDTFVSKISKVSG